MRYKNWDVLLFPGDSNTPRQEFKVQCDLAQDDEFPASDGVSGVPTMTCFTPSLEAGTAFQVSVHSWVEQPEISQSTKALGKEPEQAQFEARVFIDGQLVTSTIMNKSWPCIVKSSINPETGESLNTMNFPAFDEDVLNHVAWSAADSLGRIKIVISEGFPGADGVPPERIKNIVAFSYQHAPRSILENAGLAWPSPSLWLKTPAAPSETSTPSSTTPVPSSKAVSKRTSTASLRHSHSPSRPIRKPRGVTKPRSRSRKPVGNGNRKVGKRNGAAKAQRGSPQFLVPPNGTAAASPMSQAQDTTHPMAEDSQSQSGRVSSQPEGTEPSGQPANKANGHSSASDITMSNQGGWTEEDLAWLSAQSTLHPLQMHLTGGENFLLDQLPTAPGITSTPSRGTSSLTPVTGRKAGHHGIYRGNGTPAAPFSLQFASNQGHPLLAPMAAHRKIPAASPLAQGATFQCQSREFTLDPMNTDPFGIVPQSVPRYIQSTPGNIPVWTGSNKNHQNSFMRSPATTYQGHYFSHLANGSHSRPSLASNTNGCNFSPHDHFVARCQSTQPSLSSTLAQESSSSEDTWSAEFSEAALQAFRKA